jgi:ABC-type lipoprotein export system ATPase subunit
MLLVCDNVSKTYDGLPVLAGIDMTVHPGESVALVGASGEGKSTLLSILGLLLAPTAGCVVVDGVRSDELDDKALSALRAEAFGFVFQHNQLIGSLRALDNVLVPSCFAYQGDCQARALQLMDRFDLSDRLYHYPHQLSVGQKRRVALARALLLSPRMLIADEPTNDLDPITGNAVIRELLAFPDENHAVIYATHDMDMARRADRVVHLHDGKAESITHADLSRIFASSLDDAEESKKKVGLDQGSGSNATEGSATA